MVAQAAAAGAALSDYRVVGLLVVGAGVVSYFFLRAGRGVGRGVRDLGGYAAGVADDWTYSPAELRRDLDNPDFVLRKGVFYGSRGVKQALKTVYRGADRAVSRASDRARAAAGGVSTGAKKVSSNARRLRRRIRGVF
jgi:hypothetical protein